MHAETKLTDVIKLDPTLQHQASQLLAHAFFNEPLMVYYLPDTTVRQQVLTLFMLILLRYSLVYGEVWTNPELDGVACWLPPGNIKLGAWGLLRASLGVFPLRFFLPGLRGAEPDGLEAIPLRRKWQFMKKLARTENEIDKSMMK